MATQDAVQGSSVQVGSTQATSSTGTSGGSAGNNTTGSVAGTTPTSTPVIARMGFRLELQQMLQGWQAVMPSDSALPSSAGALTHAAVMEQLQEYSGAYTAMDTQATAYKQSRVLVEAQSTGARQYFAVLKLALQSYFGVGSPQLEQFGLKPKKAPRQLTSAQKAVRAAKVLATRKLRGTKGPKQLAPIKSGPMQVSVTAVGAPTSPSASTTPDPVATGSPPASK
jgi:hypothetical protein